MELVQAYTRRQEIEVAPPAAGLAGWVVGALQGRVRLKWRGGPQRPMQQMQLLETLPLGEKRQVMLVAYEGDRYLVGCGPEAVSSIVKVTSSTAEGRQPVKTLAQTWL